MERFPQLLHPLNLAVVIFTEIMHIYAEMRGFNERLKLKDSLIIRGLGAQSDDRLGAVLNEMDGIILSSTIEPNSRLSSIGKTCYAGLK